MRRLRLSIEEIRQMLYEPKEAARLTLKHYNSLSKEGKALSEVICQLDELDLANFRENTDVLSIFAKFNPKLPLPERDLNLDDEAIFRKRMEEQEEEIQQLQDRLKVLGKKCSKRLILLGLSVFIILALIGFLISPYLYW